jgi:hypothetical protein
MHPETERGLSYPPYDDQPKREKKWKDIWSLGTGGLVEMLALVNSLVLAAIFMLLTRSPSGWIVVPLGLTGFAAAWIYQFVYVMYSYNKGKPRRERIRFPTPREVEATLIICSEEPELIAREIAGLGSIKHYRLFPQDSQEIHDRYFDTPEHALQSQRLGLRIREVGGMHLIALKGSSETSGWGSAERLEIEEIWSENAVRRMVRELRNRRVQLPPLPEDFSRVDPLDVMTRLGLEVIQDRETHREIRTIVFAGKEKGRVLAELAIDSVAYHFGDRKIRHHEVEIEAKAEGGSEAIERVTKGLMGMYEATLRPWKYSKLATGKAIEKLLKEGALKEFLDNNNNLKPSAYDRIDDLLRRGSM